MSRLRVLVGAGSLMAVVLGAAPSASAQGTPFDSAQGKPSSPTFSKDVAPILFDKCASCHRPGEVAPMSLLSYEDARPWARAIKTKVMAREMPPWDADPERSLKFKNERYMTQKEIDIVAAWADAGAPRGNPADTPKPPTFVEGWTNQDGDPDAVLELPTDWHLPAEGEIPYVQFYVKIPWAEDRFASALENRSSNKAVVHHSTSKIADLPDGHTLNEQGQAVSAEGVVMHGSLGGDEVALAWSTAEMEPTVENPGGILVGSVPGRSLQKYPDGIARRIPAGKYISINNHYQATGKPEVERTKLGLWWNKTPIKREAYMAHVTDWMIADGKQLVTSDAKPMQPGGTRVRGEKIPYIQPYRDGFKMVGTFAVPEDITVYTVVPHMHLRGKDLKLYVTYPDGREQTLLTVPRYDFNWQIYHQLETPLKVPAGSKFTGVGTYDNSAANKFNPAPEKEVYWSEQSWDEMFSPWVEYTVDSQDLTKKRTTTTADKKKTAPKATAGRTYP
jgi:hypothetical protein